MLWWIFFGLLEHMSHPCEARAAVLGWYAIMRISVRARSIIHLIIGVISGYEIPAAFFPDFCVGLLSPLDHPHQSTIAVDEMMFHCRNRMDGNGHCKQDGYHAVNFGEELTRKGLCQMIERSSNIPKTATG